MLFSSLFLLFSPGPTEIIIIFLVVLLLFGAKRIPEFARGLGQGIKEFKKASSEIKKEIQDSSHDIDESVNQEKKQSKK